jgi:hypothetical protein
VEEEGEQEEEDKFSLACPLFEDPGSMQSACLLVVHTSTILPEGIYTILYLYCLLDFIIIIVIIHHQHHHHHHHHLLSYKNKNITIIIC